MPLKNDILSALAEHGEMKSSDLMETVMLAGIKSGNRYTIGQLDQTIADLYEQEEIDFSGIGKFPIVSLGE